jgi:hypothetical protein
VARLGEAGLSTGDSNNPDPVELPVLKQILAMPIVKRNLARRYRLDRSYDIPYLAGYSWDASVIYIDRDMPPEMTWKGKPFPTDRFLELHETLEKALIDAIRSGDPAGAMLLILLQFKRNPIGTERDDLELYFRTHGAAEAYEEHTVQLRIGSDGLAAYDKFMDAHVKTAEHERIIRVPPDLDLTPYAPASAKDQAAYRLLAKLRQAMQ